MTDTVRETKRAAQIAAIHGLADWLAEHPNMPMPTLSLHRHLGSGDGTDVENLASVRSLAEQIGVGTDESLEDRTVLRYRVNEHVWYELFAWHKDGRGNLTELERLRARIAELEAQHGIPAEPERCETCGESLREIERGTLGHIPGEACAPAADPTGLAYTRADDEPDDPTPVSPARVPMHTGAMTDGGLVDETAAEPGDWNGLHVKGCEGAFGRPCRCLAADPPRTIEAHLAAGGTVENTPDGRLVFSGGLVDETASEGHFYIGDGRSGCDELLAGKVRCGAGRDQHPLAASES